MKRFLLLLLLAEHLLGLMPTIAQDLKFRVADFQQDQFDLTAKELDKNDGDGYAYALIKVTSDVEDDDLQSFKFDFTPLRSVQEMRDGELWVFVQRNAKHVEIRRKGYKTVKENLKLTIKEGATYKMSLSVQPPKITQRVLQFVVDPKNEGAIVKVKRADSDENYQLWGTVDANGSMSRLLETGEYLYEVSANNYKTSMGNVHLVNGEGNLVENVKLTPNFGYLEVADAYGIAGADVYIDNKKVGKIPYKSGRMECRNDYQIMISNGELYKTYNATFEIKQGETTKLSPRLESNFAETTIKVDGAADIYINGTHKGQGTWTGPLTAGTYNIECRLTNHVSTQRQITIKPNVAETFVMDKPLPIEGSLYVSSNPSGAKIYIDGVEMSQTTPYKFGHILIGTHKVTIMLANHKTENKTVNVKQDETSEVDVTLGNIARMTIKTTPADADLYIDGKYMGTTPYSEEMASGDYNIKLMKNRYKTFSKRIHLDSSNPDQAFKLRRLYQRKTQFYLQPMYQVGSLPGYGAAIGCYIRNINIEADFLMGSGSQRVYFISQMDPEIYLSKNIKSGYNVGGKVGYGFVFGSRLRVTPQLGGLFEHIGGLSCYAVSASFGVRADYVLTNHLGIVIAPEYSFPISKSDTYAALSSISSMIKGWGGGFNCRFGINLFF